MTGNVLEYLEKTAQRVPQNVAYIDEHHQYTYAQLHEAARRIGSAAARKAAPRSAVAVLMDNRDARCVMALLGVLYAGCCYAPLDPAMPTERLEVILQQLAPALIVYDEKSAPAVEKLQGAYPSLACEEALQWNINEETLACIRAQDSVQDLLSILFTSGSTGVPKGVAQTQYAYITYTEATIEKYTFTEKTVFGNQSPFFYANSIIDIYPPIALGATTYILPGKCLTFPKTLIEHLNAGKVTELTMTPSSYVKVANADVLQPGCLPHLEYIVLSGEAAHWATLRAWLKAAPNAHVWNFYGSTEAFSVAVWQIDRECREGEVIPVGKPFDQTHILFVDEDGREAPRGEKGEMYVCSPWMSCGYYRDTERTEGVFITDPLQRGYFERMYRTGDLGYINEEGMLVVLGRRDMQIKRAGYRMELGEVEYALRTIAGWQDGCCLYDKESERLVCFWQGELTQKQIAAALRGKLPRYALPDTYIHVEQLPYTATMKIDRQKLRGLV